MPQPAPHELALIRELYTAILEEPWFNRNAITERELLKMVFRTCADATEDRETLKSLCRLEARRRFSRPG